MPMSPIQAPTRSTSPPPDVAPIGITQTSPTDPAGNVTTDAPDTNTATNRVTGDSGGVPIAETDPSLGSQTNLL